MSEDKKPRAFKPKRENPIPGSPEIDGKFPGDEGYDYEAAYAALTAEAKGHEDAAAAAVAVRHKLGGVRPEPKKLTSTELWLSQQATRRMIQAESDEKKNKIAAVLREMKLI
jgi:hypothetical protein